MNGTKLDLLKILRCPTTSERLTLKSSDGTCSNVLVNESGTRSYPIINGIPRFVSGANYADNFGFQWNRFARTQLDSHTQQTISAERFWGATKWVPRDLESKWVLDVGCGAGRFTEVALSAGANVVAVDYSSAVDACKANHKGATNLHLVQADIYHLPFAHQVFDYIYCLGVLQHTPDVANAFSKLPPLLRERGRICVDFYFKRLRTSLHMKYALRPITKLVPQERLFRCIEKVVPVLLPISKRVKKIPIIGRILQRSLPIADYSGDYPLNDDQLLEWAILDTFDWLAPKHDNPQSPQQVKRMFESNGFRSFEVEHFRHLVGRSSKEAD